MTRLIGAALGALSFLAVAAAAQASPAIPAVFRPEAGATVQLVQYRSHFRPHRYPHYHRHYGSHRYHAYRHRGYGAPYRRY